MKLSILSGVMLAASLAGPAAASASDSAVPYPTPRPVAHAHMDFAKATALTHTRPAAGDVRTASPPLEATGRDNDLRGDTGFSWETPNW
jgi:hypothetical protein